MAWPNINGYVVSYTQAKKDSIQQRKMFQLWHLFDVSQMKKGVLNQQAAVDYASKLGYTFGFDAGDALSVTFVGANGRTTINNSGVKTYPASTLHTDMYHQMAGGTTKAGATIQWQGRSVSQFTQPTLLNRLSSQNVVLAITNLRESAKFNHSISISPTKQSNTNFSFPNVHGQDFDGLKSVYGNINFTSGSQFWNGKWKVGIQSLGRYVFVITNYIQIGKIQFPASGTPPRPRPQPTPPPPPPPPPPPTKEVVEPDPAPAPTPPKAPTVVAETVSDPTDIGLDMDKVQIVATAGDLVEGFDYPVTLPAAREMPGLTKDLTHARVDNTAQAQAPESFDGKKVAVFEINQADLVTIMDNKRTLTDTGKNVIIRNKETNGYRFPIAYLDKEWTYNTPHVNSVLEMKGDKTFRISDEGKLMITLKTKYGLYSYIFMPLTKEEES